MSLSYGFYDSNNGDRVYDSSQFSSIFDGVMNDGVFANYGNKLFVSAGTGMFVTVASGRAWFDQTWTLNDGDISLELDSPDLAFSRIDAVILEVDASISIRGNSIKVLKGTPASVPRKPSLQHEANINQYALAYVTIANGVSGITQSDIENVVGNSETPYASNAIVDIASLSTEVKRSIQGDYRSLLINRMYPVGSIYTSTDSTNPSLLFGGTWEAISGQFLVGVGTGTDVNGVSKIFTEGESGGEITHLLTENEMPSHNHNGGTVSEAPNHTHKYVDYYDPVTPEFNRAGANASNPEYYPKDQGGITGYIYGSYWTNEEQTNPVRQNLSTSEAPVHTHTLQLNSVGGTAHNNMPPYLAVYMWKRVA